MIVVISNKLKSVVDSSKLADADCKYAIGYYSTDDCIRTLSSYEMDYLIIDITSLKDAFEVNSWKKFSEFFNPEKTIILLDETKSYSNIEFLSMLVTMGFYNFTKTGEGLLQLMQYPNTYSNVSKYQQMAMSIEEKKEREEEQVSEYTKNLYEKQEMMRDYLEKYQKGEVRSSKKDDTLKFQVKTGLLVLPILTFISVFLIYLLEVVVAKFVPATNDYLGEYLYGELANTGFTPLTIIGIMLIMVLFAFYYSFLNAKIKRKQKTRVKFIVIPFAIYCVIIFGDYYLLGIFEKLYEVIKIFPIDDKPYLVQNLYDLSRWVATSVILLYYASTFVNNSKTLKFEKDLSQNLTVIEKFWVVDMVLLLLLPLAYQLSRALSGTNPIYQVLSTIYDQPFAMMLLAGLEFILTILILLQPKFMTEKEYTILKEEDL